jgi:tetratricopeptide (TPR) repeat protein
MGKYLDRARALIDLNRPGPAEEEVRREIATEPDNAEAHALLARILSRLERHGEAEEAARQAIHLAPGESDGHFALAAVLVGAERMDEAERAIDTAIRLAPYYAGYFALLGAIHLERRRWEQALAAAEHGLELDPEHVDCLNVRATALRQLGRPDEAEAATLGALELDPESSFSHATAGWNFVQRGDYERAATHFREALRLEPDNEMAREGILAVLKARNPIYRVMLRYFLFMSKLSGRMAWFVIIGAYVGQRLLRELVKAQPGLAPIVVPVLVLYFGFAFLSWAANPLFNLLLRVNPLGRAALTPRQVVASNWVGGLLVVAVASLVLWFATDRLAAVTLAAVCGMMIIPVSGAFEIESTRGRKVLGVYAIVMGILGAVIVGTAVVSASLATGPVTLFVLGFFGFGWVANAYMLR